MENLRKKSRQVILGQAIFRNYFLREGKRIIGVEGGKKYGKRG